MPLTFNQICEIAKATPEERDKAAWFLAQMRAKKTYEELRTIAPRASDHASVVPGMAMDGHEP